MYTIRHESGQRHPRGFKRYPGHREQEGEATAEARGLYRSYVRCLTKTWLTALIRAPGIKTSSAPYSKTQKRRFNRKRREQLGSGLGSIEAVISALEGEEISPPAEAQSNATTSQQRPQAKAGTALIGEGKGAPLTKAQRKHALCVLNTDAS
jgi:hypothetical protein